jgi:hypothetical protein
MPDARDGHALVRAPARSRELVGSRATGVEPLVERHQIAELVDERLNVHRHGDARRLAPDRVGPARHHHGRVGLKLATHGVSVEVGQRRQRDWEGRRRLNGGGHDADCSGVGLAGRSVSVVANPWVGRSAGFGLDQPKGPQHAAAPVMEVMGSSLVMLLGRALGRVIGRTRGLDV